MNQESGLYFSSSEIISRSLCLPVFYMDAGDPDSNPDTGVLSTLPLNLYSVGLHVEVLYLSLGHVLPLCCISLSLNSTKKTLIIFS